MLIIYNHNNYLNMLKTIATYKNFKHIHFLNNTINKKNYFSFANSNF